MVDLEGQRAYACSLYSGLHRLSIHDPHMLHQDKGIAELLHKPGTLGIPGCVGTRNLKDCLSDLKAQVAANQRGIELVKSLIAEYDLRTVHSYMYHIQVRAED